MAGPPAGMELCPHCARPFKRLKSHLPHCKMVPAGGENNQNPGLLLPLSPTASKPRPAKIQPAGKGKKQRQDTQAAGQAKVTGEGQKGNTEIVKDRADEKLELVELVRAAGTRIDNASAIKQVKEKGRPVNMAAKRSGCLGQRKELLSGLTETMNYKESHTQDLPPLHCIGGHPTFSPEGASLYITAEYPLSGIEGLHRRKDLFVNHAVQSHLQVEQTAVTSRLKQAHAAKPLSQTVVQRNHIHEQNLVQVKQRPTTAHEEGAFGISANNSPIKRNWKTKPSNLDSQGMSKCVHHTAKSDRRETLLMEEGGRINLLHLESEAAKMNLVGREKEKSNGPGVMKTPVHDLIKEPLQKSIVLISGNAYHRLKKLEQGKEARSEAKGHATYLENDTSSNEPLPVSQNVGTNVHTGMAEDKPEEEERSGICMACLQQVTKNQHQKAFGPSTSVPKEGEQSNVQNRNMAPCASPSSTVDSAGPWQSSCSQTGHTGLVGLQWILEFYPSYQELNVIPGTSRRWEGETRATGSIHPSEEPLAAHNVPLSGRRLMNVTLGELPSWLASIALSPREFPGAVQRAWGRYHSKYINVKKGGFGGIAMLLGGYCILGYVWNYQHIKLDRWRKYH